MTVPPKGLRALKRGTRETSNVYVAGEATVMCVADKRVKRTSTWHLIIAYTLTLKNLPL